MSYPTSRLFYKLLLGVSLLIPFSTQASIADITRIYKQTPKLEAFEICTGGGCAEIKQVAVTGDEWKVIADIFEDASPTKDAVLERKHIAEAIGALEKIVGAKTGTSTDRAGTFDNSRYPGQLDCNDEAINSTTYMRLMYQHGLIKLHVIEDMRTRSYFLFGWPHSTAVIHELTTGERYAVDSWFYDNGYPATIVPFATWKSGYFPADSPILKSRSDVK
ncbi:hypothetical protein C3Y98_07605 [Methylotenera oryzisoli]|uniref:Uncharacterized protein n=1 Tax=Methylotenera oryzisoli TaxID=2080758 RepID=A0A4Y9VQQ7_9PROT|nr:hypothetical protein [Methylotenera oryzisoli]TFW71128.1 hypothetical protein C3Y98_07605 [Methylotenera oryzisoli]